MELQRSGALRFPTPAGIAARRHPPTHAAVASSHIVQFYENDQFLCATVADFLADGIGAGQPTVVIATEAHRVSITQMLHAKGFFPGAPGRHSGVWLDARETLQTFMVGARPDRDRFYASVGAVVESSRRSTPHAVVRAYGEMVDLLWKDGNVDGAVQLEALWNELGRTQRFALLCAYAMGNFSEEAHGSGFSDICHQHEHVIPTEDYTQADDEARLREISRLQQQAQVLKSEIARRKDLEQQLREALAREQAARAATEDAMRAKGEFLAIMSHELRTPLNAIGGYVQLVEMGIHGTLTQAQREALERVQHSQRYLLALVNQVLDLARIEQGQVAYTLEPISVAQVVSASCAVVEPLLLPKQLTCHVVPADPSLVVHADREKVQQILLNLLSNAIKFTPPSGRITVEAGRDPTAHGRAFIRVKDTGTGIPAADQESVFAPFIQLSPKGETRYEGAGLGLAISRNLARGMNGDLTVTSTPHEGATFTLTLPLTASDAATASQD